MQTQNERARPSPVPWYMCVECAVKVDRHCFRSNKIQFLVRSSNNTLENSHIVVVSYVHMCWIRVGVCEYVGVWAPIQVTNTWMFNSALHFTSDCCYKLHNSKCHNHIPDHTTRQSFIGEQVSYAKSFNFNVRQFQVHIRAHKVFVGLKCNISVAVWPESSFPFSLGFI